MKYADLEVVRATAVIEVARRSIRDIAREIGISHGTMFNFLHAKTEHVYGKTARKLQEWYANKVLASGPPTADAARSLLDGMVTGIPPHHRDEARHVLVRALASLYRRFEAAPPPWLEELTRTSTGRDS